HHRLRRAVLQWYHGNVELVELGDPDLLLQPELFLARGEREDARDRPPARIRRRRAILDRFPAPFHEQAVDPDIRGAASLLFLEQVELIVSGRGNAEVVLGEEGTFLTRGNVLLPFGWRARAVAALEAAGVAHDVPRGRSRCSLEHR